MNPLYIFDYLQIVYRACVISISSAIYTWGEVHFQQREKHNFIFQIVTLIITNYKKKFVAVVMSDLIRLLLFSP